MRHAIQRLRVNESRIGPNDEALLEDGVEVRPVEQCEPDERDGRGTGEPAQAVSSWKFEVRFERSLPGQVPVDRTLRRPRAGRRPLERCTPMAPSGWPKFEISEGGGGHTKRKASKTKQRGGREEGVNKLPTRLGAPRINSVVSSYAALDARLLNTPAVAVVENCANFANSEPQSDTILGNPPPLPNARLPQVVLVVVILGVVRP